MGNLRHVGWVPVAPANPGRCATFRKVADAGVNIDLLLPVRVSAEEFLAVICAENFEAAARALGDQAVSD
jgi:hypothetical protein